MSSARSKGSSDKGAPQQQQQQKGPPPLIPERKRYVYKPSPMTEAARNIAMSMRAQKFKVAVPLGTTHATTKLVHVLCTAAQKGAWDPECERALTKHLPVREHHKAFLSHATFVTMIGAVVARALEQATHDSGRDDVDLLADRHFVRSIACHDSSKTSKVEAVAYSGIMAVHLEKEALQANAKKRHGHKDAASPCSLSDLYADTEALTTPMANFGFKHHYETNPHHPEHFAEGEMEDVNLVEALVDGLACIFERNKAHFDVSSWLGSYYLDRFKGRNRVSAGRIMEDLGRHITEADYKALVDLRRSVFSIVGESVAWSRVVMTACCAHGGGNTK